MRVGWSWRRAALPVRARRLLGLAGDEVAAVNGRRCASLPAGMPLMKPIPSTPICSFLCQIWVLVA